MSLRFRAFLILVLVAAVVGCGGPKTVSEPPHVAAPGEEEPISKVGQGGTAHIALPASLAPACMNPYLPKCAGAGTFTGMTLESPLILGPSSEYRPLLAEAIPSFEDGTLTLEPMTVEVRLRRGVNFSDGEPLTSADAKWTYEAAMRLARDDEISAPYSGFARVERVETPDARTVRIVFREPYSQWRDLLTAPILPRHIYGDRALKDLTLTRAPVGSGPFLLKHFSPDGLKLIDTPRYWVSEPPYPNLSGLRVDFLDPGRVSDALSSGLADFGFFQDSDAVPRSGNLLRATAPSRVALLVFNSRRLEDRTLRGRISESLDRESLPDGVVGGARAAQSFVPPAVPGYEPAWQGGKAKDAGSESVKTGNTLDLVYPAEDPVYEELARKLSSQLSGAGVGVASRPVSDGEYQDVLRRGDFDLALYTTSGTADLEPLLPSFPPDSRKVFEESLQDVEGGGLVRAQEKFSEDAA
ncbi:MAG TPA: ABC transporter substrate-binding protein, partial [Rubrobacteraceae bacterium]|nr:ABC transporter substrate-binding protein [Rubrobacteraceae bacterium]